MADGFSPRELKEKLLRALRAKAVLAERSKQLHQQVEDLRHREGSQDHVTSELLERQRELNYMLHRASSVLHQLQDTNIALSAEFTHIVKELPAPKGSNWDETISRVNDLFKKTHELAGDMQDEIFGKTSEPIPVQRQASATATQPEPQTVVRDLEPVEHLQTEAIQDAEFETHDESPAASNEAPQTQETSARETTPDDPVEELFSRVNTAGLDDDSGKWDREPSDPERKPGLFTRMLAWLNRNQ